MSSPLKICPVCTSTNLEQSLSIDTPIFCNVLFDSAAQAVAAPQGRIAGVFCKDCAHFFNSVFDETLLEYNEDYETSLHFSASFEDYANTLANHLVQTYGITGKNIIEIGCGRGDFLKMICSRGENTGYGFDRTFKTRKEMEVDHLHFSGDYYSSDHQDIRADLVVCRHVLEHLSNPVEFLKSLRDIPSWNRDTIVYFEVPNGMYSFADLGIWDLIYEHFSYFNATSLRHVFERAGFEVLNVRETFGGQYLALEARPSASNRAPEISVPSDVIACLENMQENFTGKMADWNQKIEGFLDAGFAVWGAGSKGVSFVNLTERGAEARCIVDVNPRKQNRFVAGVGLEVISPERLKDAKVGHVVIMNPVYADEIQQMLSKHSISAKVVVA